MSGIQHLLSGGSLQSAVSDSRASGALFSGATWDQVGTNEALTSFLHNSMDPSGSKYGGNTDALKEDLLNTGTTKSNSALASIWDAIGARSEGQGKRQFENLIGRLYENAPNRLVSGNANDTYQAVKSGLIGAVGVDLPLNVAITVATGGLGFGAKTALTSAATRALSGEAASKAIGGAVARDVGSDAILSQAASQVSKSAAWDVARQYGKTEAIEGGVAGAIGDYAEQMGQKERGLIEDTSVLRAAAGGALGAVVGGGFGVAAGRLGDGRKLGQELAQGIDGRAAMEPNLLANMPEGQRSMLDAVDAGRREADAAAAEASGMPGANTAPGGVEFDASRPSYTEFNGDVEAAHSELSVFQNKVASGKLESQYTPDQIAALRDGVARMRDMDALAEAHLNQASTLKAQGLKDGNPEAVMAANEASLKAANLQASVNRVLNGDFNSEKIFNDAGDIDPSLQAWLTSNDPLVAAAFAPVQAKGAAKAAPAPTESAPVATQNVASFAPSAPLSTASIAPVTPAAPIKSLEERVGALTMEASAIESAVAKASTPASTGAPAAPRAMTPVESAIVMASSSSRIDPVSAATAIKASVDAGRLDVANVIVERVEQAAVREPVTAAPSAPIEAAKPLEERLSTLTAEVASVTDQAAMTPVQKAISVATSPVNAELPALRQAVSDAVAEGRVDVAQVIIERAEQTAARTQAAVASVTPEQLADPMNVKVAAEVSLAKVAQSEATELRAMLPAQPASSSVAAPDVAALRALIPAQPAATAAPGVATAAPTAQVTAQAATPPSGPPTAQEITSLSEKFTPQDKQAVVDLNSMLTQAGTDLQSVLDSVAKVGQSQAVTDVVTAAKTKGVTLDRAAVQQTMANVTAAAHKERVSSAPAVDAAVASAASTPEGKLAQIAEQAAAIEARAPMIDQLATVAAKQQFEKMEATVTAQMDEAGKALDTLLEAIEQQVSADKATFGEAAEKLAKEEKVGIVSSALAKAIADNPDLKPLIGMLDPAKLTSAKGTAKAKADLKELALDTISWSYAKAIEPVLADATNVSHFDTVIDAVLKGVPSDRVNRIKADYAKLVNNALVDRIEAIGIVNVKADPRLNAILERMISTSPDGMQQFGAKASGKLEVGSLVNQYADRVMAHLAETKATAPIKDLQMHLDKAAGAVRDFHKHFVDAGLPQSFFESQLYMDAMHVKARNAVEYELAGGFRTANAGDFEKMAAMGELRERDAQKGKFARTPSHARNMFFGGFDENPILHRVMDEAGNPNDQIVSGRQITTGPLGVRKVGKPQGILSDGISDYLGFLWAQPRKMFTAAAMARKAIYGAAIENTNWSAGSLMIDGVLEKGAKKILIGKYSENINQRMAQSRFNLILDAVERKSLPTDDPRYLSADDFTKQIEGIGSRSQNVSTDELAVATGFINHKTDMASSMTVQRTLMSDAIDKAATMGESPAAVINAIMDRTTALMTKSDNRLTELMQQAGDLIAPASINSRSKGRKGKAEGAEQGTKAKEGPPKPPDRDDSTLIVQATVNRGGKTEVVPMNVVPSQATMLNPDGTITLFGQKIGTWEKPAADAKGDPIASVTLDGMEQFQGKLINDLTSMMRAKSFMKRFQSNFDNNAAKMVPSSEAEAALPPGSVIDSAVASTKEVTDAKRELLNPAAVGAADMERTISSYTVAEGHALMVRDKASDTVKRPGPNQGDMTLAAWLKRVGIDQADAELGSGVAKVQRKSGAFVDPNATERKAGFTAMGRDTGTVDPAVVKAMVERDARVAPALLAARTRPISVAEAEKIKMDDGTTLASLSQSFDMSTAMLSWSKIPDVGALKVVIASLQKQADQLAALAPLGIKRDNASRRQSFSRLEEHLAQFDLQERQSALDMLRRLDTEAGGMPYFYAGGEKGNSFAVGTGADVGKSRIYLGGSNDGGLPKHIVVTHEVGHWAFVNMLTPQERIQFLQSLAKHYKADGTIDADAVMKAMPNAREVEKALGKKLKGATLNTNELFAWQFTSWYMDKMVGKENFGLENSLWEKVAKGAKNLLAHFMGSPVDKDLVPLFERILPSNIGESKFNYATLTDNKTGEAVAPKDITNPKSKPAAMVVDMMQKIDEKRSIITQHLFTPGHMVEAGFTEDLKAAAGHMFGLLYGNGQFKDGKVKGYKPGKNVQELRNKLLSTDASAGSVDPRALFDRNDTGKLMQAIRDVTPEGKADDIAFEAAAGAEEFAIILKASAVGDMPDVALEYKRSLIRNYEANVKGGMSEDDALDKAELMAMRDAAALAKSDYNIDVSSSMFDEGGARVKLGNEQQREALGGVARKLHDLMGDALDHLESKVDGLGYRLERNTRQVAAAERTPEVAAFEKAVEKEVVKTKAKKARTKVAPKDEKSASMVAKEETERFDGVADGVPAGAPAEFHTLVARVPHRDPAQSSIIGTMMYRLFSVLKEDGDLSKITNADIYRLTGDQVLRQADEAKGFKSDAYPSDETASFGALRSAMRRTSEFLTNGNVDPAGAVLHVREVLARIELSKTDARFSQEDLMKAVDAYAQGKELPSRTDAEAALMDAAAEVHMRSLEILSDLGTSARSKRATGDFVVATPGRPQALRYADGTYHPATATASVQTRLSQLPETVAGALLEAIGVKVKEGQTLAQALSDNVGYLHAKGGVKKVFTTKDEMLASMDSPAFAETDALISKLLGEGKVDEAQALLVTREAQAKVAGGKADGVDPVLLNMEKVLDVAMVTDVQTAGIVGAYRRVMEKLAEGGDAKSAAAVRSAIESATTGTPGPRMVEAMRQSAGDAAFNKMLASLGYQGVLNGETVTILKSGLAKGLEEQITKATKSLPAGDATNVPLVGEVLLHMAIDETARVNPMALEHRALQAGASPEVAKVLANMHKKGRSGEGLTEAEAVGVRKFHGVQLMSNAARIGRAGAEYLRNLIAPVNGTGFENAVMSKMGASLMPLNAEIDRLAGVDTWYKKTLNEIVRNNPFSFKHTIPQSPMEEGVSLAMRKNSIDGLTKQEKTLALSMKAHFKSLLNMQRDAGIPVGDIAGDGFYLPQRFNLEWIRHNRDDAIKMLGDWFIKDRGGEVGTARVDAAKVINDAINKEELQGFLDSSNSVYTQAFGDKLHSRKLNIEGADWTKMAPMFDNNLRSLLISYTEAAHKRVEWTQRFGVRGHGASTYVDIAERGSKGAMDAFMGQAQGMSYVSSGVRGGATPADGLDKSVEFTASLFPPMAKSEQEAAMLTANVMKLLEAGKDKLSRDGIVEMIMSRYMSNGGSGEMHFRKRAEAIVNGLADFGDQGGQVARGETDFMLKMVGTLEGRPAHTIMANQGLRDAAAAVKTFNSVSLLSGAVLSSLADPVLSLIRSGSMSSWLKGTTESIKLASKDPAMATAMMRVGVGLESILNENLTHVNGGLSGKIGNAFFQGTLLTPWTNANRQVAALVGFESIKANQVIIQRERMAGNLDSWQYGKSMRYLRQLGLGHLAEGKKLNSFTEAMDANYPESQKLAEAIHKFTSESVFQPSRNDIPLWAQDPIASVLWQFKSFPMMMGRLVKHNIKEAFAAGATKEGKDASIFTKGAGKYEGDPAGLLYLLTIGAAAGAGSLYVKDHVLGKNQEAEDGNWRSTRERSLSKIAQEFGFKDYEMDNPVLDVVMGNYVNGLLGLGALGFLGDLMFQSAKSVDNGAFGRERIMSQIGGPTLGLFSDALQMVEGAKAAVESEEEGGAKERNAVRKVLKRIPVFGGQDPLVEPTVDWFAGEAANPR